jgi:hypothetical protein
MVTLIEKAEPNPYLTFSKSLKKQALIVKDFRHAFSRVIISIMLRAAYLLPVLYEQGLKQAALS